MTYALSCPWCAWFGATNGVGDDSPADFLKEDFIRHVRADHPEREDAASHIEAEHMKRQC